MITIDQKEFIAHFVDLKLEDKGRWSPKRTIVLVIAVVGALFSQLLAMEEVTMHASLRRQKGGSAWPCGIEDAA